MKKLIWFLALAMVLSGCAQVEMPVMETVGDICETVSAEPQSVSVWVPDGAAAEAMADNLGECYTWEDCELRIQTLRGGDLRTTLETVTGMDADRLTVMEYERQGLQLYQTVWSASTEEGVTLGRCLVADDGSYHYCISLLSPEEADVSETYAQICASMELVGEADLK